jgi:hypothetical protein
MAARRTNRPRLKNLRRFGGTRNLRDKDP